MGVYLRFPNITSSRMSESGNMGKTNSRMVENAEPEEQRQPSPPFRPKPQLVGTGPSSQLAQDSGPFPIPNAAQVILEIDHIEEERHWSAQTQIDRLNVVVVF